jgi:hypothetical protein
MHVVAPFVQSYASLTFFLILKCKINKGCNYHRVMALPNGIRSLPNGARSLLLPFPWLKVLLPFPSASLVIGKAMMFEGPTRVLFLPGTGFTFACCVLFNTVPAAVVEDGDDDDDDDVVVISLFVIVFGIERLGDTVVVACGFLDDGIFVVFKVEFEFKSAKDILT